MFKAYDVGKMTVPLARELSQQSYWVQISHWIQMLAVNILCFIVMKEASGYPELEYKESFHLSE